MKKYFLVKLDSFLSDRQLNKYFYLNDILMKFYITLDFEMFKEINKC